MSFLDVLKREYNKGEPLVVESEVDAELKEFLRESARGQLVSVGIDPAKIKSLNNINPYNAVELLEESCERLGVEYRRFKYNHGVSVYGWAS